MKLPDGRRVQGSLAIAQALEEIAPVPMFARQAGVSDERVRRDLAGLPGLLDEVDGLLEREVIGGQELGAADFQIGSSIRMLLAMEDVGQLVAGRPRLSRFGSCPTTPTCLLPYECPTVKSSARHHAFPRLATICSADQPASGICAPYLKTKTNWCRLSQLQRAAPGVRPGSSAPARSRAARGPCRS